MLLLDDRDNLLTRKNSWLRLGVQHRHPSSAFIAIIHQAA